MEKESFRTKGIKDPSVLYTTVFRCEYAHNLRGHSFLELTKWATLASHQAPGMLLTLPPSAEITSM